MLATLLLAALPAQEPTGIALDVAVALTMEERQVVHNARILVRDGRIEQVGRRAEVPLPDGYLHLEYLDSFAWPGAVDLHSHVHSGGFGDTNDMVHPDNPELRVLDTVVPGNGDYRDALASGVTLVNAIPGSGTNISGAGALVRTRPTHVVDEAVMRSPGSVKVAQGYNPERSGGDLGQTRMGMWWMLRWFLARGAEAAEGDLYEHPEIAHVGGIFQGRYPFLVHTAGARDVYGTVRMFALEAGVPVIVSHGSFSGYQVGAAIAKTGVPLNVGPRNFDFSFNAMARVQGLVEGYTSTGNTDISVQTDSPVIPQEDYLLQAAMAERLGAPTWAALEAINVRPARQILVSDQVGRLAPGLQADIVVSAGQPLDLRHPVQLVLIEGEVVYDIRDGQRF